MSDAVGNGGVVTAVVEITRKETGEKETYKLTGRVSFPADEEEGEE